MFSIFLNLMAGRRGYTVAAENVNMLRKTVDPTRITTGNGAVEKEVFWMKDPKTGNWIPETHFDDVDAADLRAKFLSKKP